MPHRIRLTGSPANFIELAALLLKSLAFSYQHFRPFAVFQYATYSFAQRRYMRRVMPFSGFDLIPQNGGNVDDDLN
jgi:hypothetical protein